MPRKDVTENIERTASHAATRASDGALPHDLRAGLVVFLVAIPLCLGIALASNAPLLAGLVAGVVGGIVVTAFSRAPLAVSGPAAGLTVLVIAGIEDLGGYAPFLTAVVLAGAFQVVFGFLRGGIIAYYFPTSVIKGLLAAIGAILILKQIPHAVGWDKDAEGDFNFLQADGHNSFDSIAEAFTNMSAGAAIICAVSLALLLIWPKIAPKLRVEQVPAPLIAVVGGTLLHELFKSAVPGLAVSPDHLVQIPRLESIASYREILPAPDWSVLAHSQVWITGLVLALVASLETLLCVEAIDKLDPYRRSTPASRELKAQGVGNMVSGFLGGIPVTAVIVRGSANVQSGGRTRMAAFFHGVLLLLAILAIPGLLGRIPLSALAAVLLLVGYRLAPLSLFARMWRQGANQFLPFIATFVAILLTDLMIGSAIGVAFGVFFVLREHVSASYYLHEMEVQTGEGGPLIHIELSENVSFLNKAAISEVLAGISDGTTVEIDASLSRHVDRDALEIINDFRVSAPLRGIEVQLHGLAYDARDDSLYLEEKGRGKIAPPTRVPAG